MVIYVIKLNGFYWTLILVAADFKIIPQKGSIIDIKNILQACAIPANKHKNIKTGIY